MIKLKFTQALLVGAAAAAALLPVAAAADEYPSRPIRLVVAYGAGSGADTIARILAEHLQGPLKGSVVVDNRPGAGGAIGTQSVARAPADGYTLILAPTTLTVSPHMQAAPTYDAVKDFAPIMRVAILPMTVVAAADAPFKTLPELVAQAQARPGQLHYATSGKGSPSHLEMELLRKHFGIQVRDVPYRTGSQALTDLISGQVSFYFPVLPAALPQMQAGRLRALAVGTPQRSPQAPDVPTLAELLNKPGYEASVWYGLLAPAGTPPAIIERLHRATAQALESPQLRQAVVNTGSEVSAMPPPQFASFIREENTKWGALVKELGLQE